MPVIEPRMATTTICCCRESYLLSAQRLLVAPTGAVQGGDSWRDRPHVGQPPADLPSRRLLAARKRRRRASCLDAAPWAAS
jgi:hypothetical protein